MECRHLDSNPLNNKLENLVWGTPAENLADRRALGRGIVLDERRVRYIRSSGKTSFVIFAVREKHYRHSGKSWRATSQRFGVPSTELHQSLEFLRSYIFSTGVY